VKNSRDPPEQKKKFAQHYITRIQRQKVKNYSISTAQYAGMTLWIKKGELSGKTPGGGPDYFWPDRESIKAWI
jgi:hypothetical protein